LSYRCQRAKLLDCVSDWLYLTRGINDLTAGCLLHKFTNETTLSEIIAKDNTSNMDQIMRDVVGTRHMVQIKFYE